MLKAVQCNSSSNGCFDHPATSLNGFSAWGWTSQVLEKSLPLCQSILLFVQVGSSKNILWTTPCFTLACNFLQGVMRNLPVLSQGNVQLLCQYDYPRACPFFSFLYNRISTHFKTFIVGSVCSPAGLCGFWSLMPKMEFTHPDRILSTERGTVISLILDFFNQCSAISH